MKKPFSLFVLFVSLFLLAACEGEDSSVTIVIKGEESLEEEIVFTDEESLFDILKEHYELEYLETDYGPMIEGIESLQAGPQHYIAIYRNDEPIDVGIDQVDFESGDAFRFEKAWLDETAEAVDSALTLFLDQQADSYLTDANVNVLLGLYHLGEDFDVDFDDDSELEAGALASKIFKSATTGEVDEALYDRLEDKATLDHLYSASYMYMGLALSGDVSIYGEFEDALIALIKDASLDEKDNDTLSMMLLAMSVYEGNALDERNQEVKDHLIEHVYDNLYGDNAASYALTVMALLSQGVDPTGEEFVEEGKHLVDHLLAHQTDEGDFKWSMADEEADAAFTTPQAFLALSMLQTWYQGVETPHPYIIE